MSLSSGIGSYCSGYDNKERESVSLSKGLQSVSPEKKQIRIVYFDGMESSSGHDDSSIYSSALEASSGEEYSVSIQHKGNKRKKVLTKKKKVPKLADYEEDDKIQEAAAEPEYSVEKILDMKYDNKQRKNFYYVKWLNYDSSDNTWEPEEHLEKCKDVLNDFISERGLQSKVKANTKNSRKKRPASNARKKRKTECPGIHNVTSGEIEVLDLLQQTTKTYSVATSTTTAAATIPLNRNKSNHSIIVDSNIQKNFEVSAKIVLQKNESLLPALPLRPKISNSSVQETEMIDLVDEEEETKTSIKSSLATVKEIEPITTTTKSWGNSHIVYLRVVNEFGSINYLRINVLRPVPDPDEIVTCVVTEDLSGKEPKLLYGATTSSDGNIFCLVQFEGEGYVDIIPHDNLFQRYPSYKHYFEMHCPDVFSALTPL